MIETASFPLIRILNKDAGDKLILAVARELINKERFRLLPGATREAAFEFVTGQNYGEVEANQLEEQCKDTNLWECLLLCRGLLGSGGILRFVLQQKRWRVDYGLDPTRTLLAVPYRAKDVPSLRADFGHPDVAIALTCLSYYYGGLTAKELDLCFELLFKLDNPSLEYEAWVADDHAMPTSLRNIAGVNLDDVDQRKNHLFPLFYRNHATINFYLSNIVFPKEAKQFPKKLATSAWDLAETKSLPTTGFSGTNDNHDLLPTSIEQRDPLDQLSTNARVLSYLLQPENDHYVCLQRDGQPLASRDFLELIVQQSPPVRVLLDVGAQMLDLRNTELARTWLSLEQKLHAVVFFDDADHLVVMSRDQSIEPFISSQYNQKLDLCGIYLDDAHTRGTDLKLPVGFRAAVTLGPKLTKDRLVQGCMRMRKLGHGHSVMFFAPPEVDRFIRELHPSEDVEKPQVPDILRWVMSETCDYIEHHLSHWAQQGVEYKRRSEAWAAYDSNSLSDGALDKLRASWEEPDARTLEEMYARGRSEGTTPIHPAFDFPELAGRLRALDINSLGSSQLDEEQERELSHEAERERQVERPPPAQPAQHNLHPDVISLVTTGKFSPTSPAFVHLFSPLRHLGDHEWSTALWATNDFSTTVKDTSKSSTDYLRPVNWILSVASQRLLVALSPFEVNELIPRINQSRHIHLHIYSPRVTKVMKTFEDLKFFCMPPLPSSWTPPSLTDTLQVNLWAGQLYLKDFGAYSYLCLILGLMRDDTTGSWESDGFIKPAYRRGEMALVCNLSESPLPFLKELVGLRRKGMNYLSTHMGKILNVGLLTEEAFNIS
ncbi:hypothetical protein Hypma_009272 [Hypsizygus marmoreus]|uniref:ubiquitinyl hydrolase 1 n=1 Tax=Hypsizygus marmoreus TaxID=39966 RepID=A0A369JNX2_HYPMA|nr:hypothetical protein Hypma_009272 [Hypsizygus marmoreus]